MSYQSMKQAFLRAFIGDKRKEQAQVGRIPLTDFIRKFESLPTDVEKFVYWQAQPSPGDFSGYTASIPNFGQWVNALSYNGTVNGYGMAYLRWDFAENAIRTPKGIVRGPLLQWATVDHRPPAGYRPLEV